MIGQSRKGLASFHASVSFWCLSSLKIGRKNGAVSLILVSFVLNYKCIVIYIADQPYIKELIHLPQMGQKAIQMVRGSLDAYVNKDLALAQSVMAMDDEIDDLFTVVKAELIKQIHHNAETGEQAMDLLMIAKYYERIGDHAQNIAEWVEYALTGRHKGVFLT